MRILFPVISLVAVVGAVLELTVANRLQADLMGTNSYCSLYLCDERTLAESAYQQQSQAGPGPVKMAVEVLRGVVEREPASAQRWTDLGQALAQAGSLDEATRCIRRGLQLGDTSADVLVAAGDFELSYGDKREGVRHLGRTLALTSRFDDAVFSYFTARGIETSDVLNEGLPENERAAQSYLKYLMTQGATSDAMKLWDWMRARGFGDERIAVDYTNFLVANREYGQAAEVWASRFGKSTPGYREREFVYNGEFASEPVPGAAFDWKIVDSDHATVGRGTDGTRWSLQVQFDGSANVNFENVTQKIVVKPGTYRFRAMVRTDGVTTDEGPFFRIADEGRMSVETDRLLGTSSWRELETKFVVRPATTLIELKLVRRPSLRFDNKIRGSMWIRRVSVSRE